MRENCRERRVQPITAAVALLLWTIPAVQSFDLAPTRRSRPLFRSAPTTTTTTSAVFASSKGTQQKKSSKQKSASTASSLLTWSRDSAGIETTTQIDLRATKEAGWGWWWKNGKNSAPTQPGSLLLTVPAAAVIAVDSKGEDAVPWYVDMSLALHQQPPSPWRDALPSQLDTPLHWSSSNRKELQYDHLQSAVAKQDERWRGYYDQYAKNIDYTSFVWGCDMARSRAFAGSYGNGFSTNLYAFTLLLVTVYVGLNLGTLEQAANGAGVVFAAAVWKGLYRWCGHLRTRRNIPVD